MFSWLQFYVFFIVSVWQGSVMIAYSWNYTSWESDRPGSGVKFRCFDSIHWGPGLGQNVWILPLMRRLNNLSILHIMRSTKLHAVVYYIIHRGLEGTWGSLTLQTAVLGLAECWEKLTMATLLCTGSPSWSGLWFHCIRCQHRLCTLNTYLLGTNAKYCKASFIMSSTCPTGDNTPNMAAQCPTTWFPQQ